MIKYIKNNILSKEGVDIYTLYIKKFRQLRRMTQEELAFLSGVSASYISRLESDNIIRNRSPKLSVLLDIAIALRVCANDILHYECNGCGLKYNCQKCDYLQEENDDDYDFFDDNLTFYL